MPEGLLGHVKVLELSTLVSGPYCGKLLADLGAEVIKVEPPGSGDTSRMKGPFQNDIPHPDRSGLFLYLNTNKLGVTLDLATPTGKSLFKDLAKQADVLVEDNGPSFMEASGLAYGDLKALNSGLIMTSITPFGQTGPYRHYNMYELNTFHAGGEGYMLPVESTFPFREPLKGGSIIADCVCGLSAALATLAATYSRKASGIGQHVDVSKQDALMTMVGLEVAMFSYTGEVRKRHARANLMGTPIPCNDGYVMISAFADRDWRAFAHFTGNSHWAEDERYDQLVKRWKVSNEINTFADEWVRPYSKEDLFHQLQANQVAAVPVTTAEDLVRSPQLEARDFFKAVSHPAAGELRQPINAYKFSSGSAATRPAPLLGQHNALVYCDRLGLSRQDLVTLAQHGII